MHDTHDRRLVTRQTNLSNQERALPVSVRRPTLHANPERLKVEVLNPYEPSRISADGDDQPETQYSRQGKLTFIEKAAIIVVSTIIFLMIAVPIIGVVASVLAVFR